MSMIVAPVVPTVPELPVAEHPVYLKSALKVIIGNKEDLTKVTVPKSAKVTRELPSSKSSTIHSALYSHKSPSTPPEKVCVTVVPVDTFSMTAVPAVVLVAVTVTVTTWSQYGSTGI